MQRFGIGWTIVYIYGRENFQEEVLPKLRDTYLTGNSERANVMMVWLPDIAKLRSLKLAVGCKTILKYRLNFINSLNPYPGTPKKRTKLFSAIERKMGNERQMENPMVVW